MSQPITKQPTSLHWRELHFGHTVSVDTARTVFEQLCSDGALGTIVIESRASRNGIRWLVGAHPSKVARTTQVVSSQLDVHVSSSRAGRVHPVLAGRLDAKGQLLSTAPGRVMASVRSLFALASHLEDGEEICLQLLIGHRITPPVSPRRTESGWLDLLAQSVGMTPAHGATSSRSRPAASLDDLHGAHGHLRIGIAGTSGKPRSIQLINQVLGVLRTLEASGSKLGLIEEIPSRLAKVTLPWRWTLRLRSCDFPGLTGWPIVEPPLPLIGNLHPRMLPPPALAGTDRLFARANAPGRDELVGIPIRDSLFHTHLLGPTGSGKSTVLLNLISADIAAGRGTLVIAPKGDLVSDILERVPRNRHDDVVILDPTSLTPVGFNPLDCPPSQAHVAADSLLSTVEALFKEN